MEKQHRHRVHGEPTGWVGTECVVVFIGRAWTEQVMETRPGVPQNGGNGLVFDRPRSEQGPVDLDECGVPQNRTPRDTVHLHRRPPPASMGYRRPPPASTGSCSSSLHRALLHRLLFNHPSTVYCSSSPPHHRVLFNHPSTGTPPPSSVHPALHTTESCSTKIGRAHV